MSKKGKQVSSPAQDEAIIIDSDAVGGVMEKPIKRPVAESGTLEYVDADGGKTTISWTGYTPQVHEGLSRAWGRLIAETVAAKGK